MSETVTRRRRWPWVVLAVVVLLVAGPLAWKYRPLNATERKLVGVWAVASKPEQKIRFSPSRRIGNNMHSTTSLATGVETTEFGDFEDFGSWAASSRGVRVDLDPELMPPQPWFERVQFVFLHLFGIEDDGFPITFDGEDHLVFEGDVLMRVPE